MINLIPNEEKKKKVKDFYFRLMVVFLMLLGFAVTIGCVAMFPAYFFSSIKKNLFETKLETEKKETIALLNQETVDAIADIKTKLGLVEQISNNRYIVSEEVINKILLKKMSDIKITGIAYDNSPDKGKSIILAGSAESRERLLLFKKALENDGAFKQVNLPISNFVKGTNISFSMTLIPN
jgi:hypothetical protein